MPTYDYVCDACDHAFEEFQMMSAKPLKKCPDCGKNKLRRLIGTGAGVIFKGSGFYETDYRSDSYKKAEKSESEAKSKKTDKADSKTEANADKKSTESSAKSASKSDSSKTSKKKASD